MPSPDPLVQSAEDLDAFYAVADPWDYDTNPDDSRRVARVLAAIPRQAYERTLDIGCGNGFLTVQLPGTEVVGVDISKRAVDWAARRAAVVGRGDIRFESGSIFDLSSSTHGTFDLLVVTGVLYAQYVGRGYTLVTEILRDLLRPKGILVTVHIDDWTTYRAPFTTLTLNVDPYREFFHRLEVYQK